MNWFYLQMLQAHVVLAWCSVLLFFGRGLACQFGAEWGRDSRLLTVVFTANVLLAVSGLSLWFLLGFTPLRDSWLLAKLLALLGYALCAHWALGQSKLHVLSYLAALALLAYVIGVSITRQPLLGL